MMSDSIRPVALQEKMVRSLEYLKELQDEYVKRHGRLDADRNSDPLWEKIDEIRLQVIPILSPWIEWMIQTGLLTHQLGLETPLFGPVHHLWVDDCDPDVLANITLVSKNGDQEYDGGDHGNDGDDGDEPSDNITDPFVVSTHP